MADSKKTSEIIRFHAELLIEFNQAWRVTCQELPDKQELNRIAHYLLEHAAKLYRYTGDENIRKEFTKKPLDEINNLVTAACRFVSVEEVVSILDNLCGIDDIDDEDMRVVEQSLILLDSITEVVQWCQDLSFPLRTKSFNVNLADALACAENQRELLNNTLCKMPEFVLPALEVFEGIRSLCCVHTCENAWWLGDARKGLQASNKQLSKDIKDLFSPRIERPDFIKRLLSIFDEPFQVPVMVAAASTSSQLLTIEGEPSLQLRVSKEENGEMVFELFRYEDRELPSWINEARLELWNDSGLVTAWSFDPSTGTVCIPSFPDGCDRKLVLSLRNGSVIGSITIP